MAKIVLMECKLRETRFVPKKGTTPIEVTPSDLVARFRLNPKNNQTQIAILRMLHANCFVGLVKSETTGQPVVFYCDSVMGRDLSGVLKKNQAFESRLIEVWRVESAQWDSKFDESVDVRVAN